ncbi:hypothetical protein Sjap_006261 [Stephania japonica]|uniref:DUF4378 domain-containing protein n=1 Tax=Stephania japonica TaxID=461633 RepID=A0AAP0K719_9MAGN
MKRKMQNKIAKDFLLKNGAPLTVFEHENLVSKIKTETAKAHAQTLEAVDMLQKETSDVVRTSPLFLDKNDHAFWRLRGCSVEPILCQGARSAFPMLDCGCALNQSHKMGFQHHTRRYSKDVSEINRTQSLDRNQSVRSRFPTLLLQIHIKEISKGAQKLNQILKARSLVDVGKKLLKGAKYLKVSLGMLSMCHKAADLHEDTAKQAPNNPKSDSHRQSTGYGTEIRTLTTSKSSNKISNTCSQSEKVRIPIVAKLMGLKELPTSTIDGETAPEKVPAPVSTVKNTKPLHIPKMQKLEDKLVDKSGNPGLPRDMPTEIKKRPSLGNTTVKVSNSQEASFNPLQNNDVSRFPDVASVQTKGVDEGAIEGVFKSSIQEGQKVPKSETSGSLTVNLDYPDEDDEILMHCAYEVMERKCKRQELVNQFHTSFGTTRVKGICDLVKELNGELKTVISCAGEKCNEYNAADCLHKMLLNDVENREPDVNCMWDFGWNETMSAFVEKEEVVRDVEKRLLNLLLDEALFDMLSVGVKR